MKRTLVAAVAALLCAAPVRAQTENPELPVRTQSISILPFHFLFGFYAGDYEHTVGRTLTVGAGASYFSTGDDSSGFDGAEYESDEFRYSTVEGKLRYYPSGDALNGLSFGVTVGPTFVTGGGVGSSGGDEFTAMGLGFEVARSHTMGVDRRFYYGYGGGAKRLFPMTAESGDAELVIPTLRLSVGVLF